MKKKETLYEKIQSGKMKMPKPMSKKWWQYAKEVAKRVSKCSFMNSDVNCHP